MNPPDNFIDLRKKKKRYTTGKLRCELFFPLFLSLVFLSPSFFLPFLFCGVYKESFTDKFWVSFVPSKHLHIHREIREKEVWIDNRERGGRPNVGWLLQFLLVKKSLWAKSLLKTIYKTFLFGTLILFVQILQISVGSLNKLLPETFKRIPLISPANSEAKSGIESSFLEATTGHYTSLLYYLIQSKQDDSRYVLNINISSSWFDIPFSGHLCTQSELNTSNAIIALLEIQNFSQENRWKF